MLNKHYFECTHAGKGTTTSRFDTKSKKTNLQPLGECLEVLLKKYANQMAVKMLIVIRGMDK